MGVSQKVRQKSLEATNSNRMYTPEEDQEILDYWWDKSARADLCRRLGRTQAAVAQRFYAIVKARNIDPKKYRQEKRRLAKEKAVQAGQSWTDADEMKLWRLVKAGMSLEEVSRELQRPVAECMRKLSELKLENMAQLENIAQPKESREEEPEEGNVLAESSAAPVLGRARSDAEVRFFSDTDLVVVPQMPNEKKALLPAQNAEERHLAEQPSSAVKPETESAFEPQRDDDLLDILREFPQKLRTIEQRLNDLEKANQLLRENVEFVLQQVADGLKATGGFLSEQKAHFQAFEQLKQEKQALEQELQALRTKMEEEKRELRKTYQEIDFWLGEFLNLRKIEKVASLGDLIPKLKYSYDRFGVLLNIDRK